MILKYQIWSCRLRFDQQINSTVFIESMVFDGHWSRKWWFVLIWKLRISVRCLGPVIESRLEKHWPKLDETTKTTTHNICEVHIYRHLVVFSLEIYNNEVYNKFREIINFIWTNLESSIWRNYCIFVRNETSLFALHFLDDFWVKTSQTAIRSIWWK